MGILNNMFLIIAFMFWALLMFSFIRDRSRYRNCYLLFIALVFTVMGIIQDIGKLAENLPTYTLMAVMFVLLAVPLFLIYNGIVMMKREGCSLANLLSLAFGILIAVGEAATFYAVVMPEIAGASWDSTSGPARLNCASMLLSVSTIYVSVAFLAFMLYCIFLQIIPVKRDFDYVIIHGAGLIKGDRVSKILSDRLDKAIEIYHKDPTPPKMIPSGGKGSDEKLSEAEAMAQYLIDKGTPADMIIKEDRSRTTSENLEFSRQTIEEDGNGRNTVLVTSNYHIYRALRYCRKIGFKCTGVGSHVAFYYWPSALIREFIAVHSEKKRFFVMLAGWLMCIMPIVLLYYGR